MKKKMKLNRNGRILRVFAILLVMLMIVSNLLVETQAKTSKKNSEKTDQRSECAYKNKEKIYLNKNWKYADHAKITSGYAVFYKAKKNRKGIIVGINAGHGTSNVGSRKTLCHPDGSAKVTGGTTSAGSTKAIAVSGGMTFHDGIRESTVTLRMAKILKKKLLAEGYDVLMIRNSKDVQLDNVARTVICNNVADCHIALHWDGDGLRYDKGCFYIGVPEKLKSMKPVKNHWEEHEALGKALIKGLKREKIKINGKGRMAVDLTQTSYSTIPSVDVELGNQASDHSNPTLVKLADGLARGIDRYMKKNLQMIERDAIEKAKREG